MTMKRVARWGLGTLGMAVVLMTVAHLPPVNGWIGWNHHGGSGTCPFGYGKTAVASTPRPQRTTAPGPSALGFALGTTTRVDVERWALSHAVLCHGARGGSELECARAPGALVGGLDARTLSFGFAADDTLTQIRAIRDTASADAASAEFRRTTEALHAATGAAPRTTGDASPATLALGTLSQAAAEFRTDHFHATVRATNFGERGYVLTELYAI
jgi:hypothetical protein